MHQDIEKIYGEKQQSPQTGFNAYFKTGKNGIDVSQVMQDAQALVDAAQASPAEVMKLAPGEAAQCPTGTAIATEAVCNEVGASLGDGSPAQSGIFRKIFLSASISKLSELRVSSISFFAAWDV